MPADREALKRQNLESEARRDIASANTEDDVYWPKQWLSLLAELEAAREEIAQVLARQREAVLSLRDLDEDSACRDCGGMGVKIYGNTATWHGGIGGAALTSDVCNKCWGSGDANHPWPDWRRLKSIEDERDQLKDALSHAYADARALWAVARGELEAELASVTSISGALQDEVAQLLTALQAVADSKFATEPKRIAEEALAATNKESLTVEAVSPVDG